MADFKDTYQSRTRSSLHGFEDFDKLLKNLGPEVGNKVVQAATTAAIRVGAAEIKRAAPVHLDQQSPASEHYGTIKQNIRVIRLKKTRNGERGARVDTGNAFWALFYQLGTRYQPARPWFDTAFNRAGDRMIAVLKEKIGAGIEKQAARLRGNV